MYLSIEIVTNINTKTPIKKKENKKRSIYFNKHAKNNNISRNDKTHKKNMLYGVIQVEDFGIQ